MPHLSSSMTHDCPLSFWVNAQRFRMNGTALVIELWSFSGSFLSFLFHLWLIFDRESERAAQTLTQQPHECVSFYFHMKILSYFLFLTYWFSAHQLTSQIVTLQPKPSPNPIKLLMVGLFPCCRDV